MSYRRIWLLVDEMNRCFREKLIETQRGGSQAGGASLTELGRTVLDAYRALEERVASLAQNPAYACLIAAMRDEPLPPKSER
jgi:molybdate transport system regulatory protein